MQEYCKNLVQLNKKKCKVLWPGQITPRHQYIMGVTQLGSSLAKDVVLPSQAGAINIPWAALGGVMSAEEMKGGDPSSLKRNSSMCTNTWKEGTKRTEPDSFQWRPVTDPEETQFPLNTRKHLFIVRCLSTERGCPQRLQTDIQKLPGCDPGSLLKVILEQGSWKRGPFQPLPPCDSLWKFSSTQVSSSLLLLRLLQVSTCNKTILSFVNNWVFPIW